MMRKERWVFTELELCHESLLKDTCNRDEEFMAVVPGEETAVLVLRDGSPTNRWVDGTVGVPQDIQELASEVETLNATDNDDSSMCDLADTWRDVLVNEFGNFVKFLSHPEDIIRDLVTHPDVVSAGRSMCLVLDDARDYPIVLQVQEQEEYDEAMANETEDYVHPWRVGDIRFEVSDGVPGFRQDSLNFASFHLACECAVISQKKRILGGKRLD